jgi:hypothetical protein
MRTNFTIENYFYLNVRKKRLKQELSAFSERFMANPMAGCKSKRKKEIGLTFFSNLLFRFLYKNL